MDALFKIPLNPKAVSYYLEDEKYFLKGIISTLGQLNQETQNKDLSDITAYFQENLPELIERIFPLKEPSNQIKSLQKIANILMHKLKKVKFPDLILNSPWIELDNGYLGHVVDTEYEIAILLYLIAAVYQTRATANVQTSLEYRYYFISALSAIQAAIDFISQLSPINEEHQAYPFYQMLALRKLEVEAEITKSEAFLARKKGDFEKASQLFAGAASYRYEMMNFELSEDSDNRVKIFASTELGMACFYIAVGLSNKNEIDEAYVYLLKARSYFDNAVKLSEKNTELLEAANKRLDLVNPYIDRIKNSTDNKQVEIESIPDPQPLTFNQNLESILSTKDELGIIYRICSNCHSRIEWNDKCSKCNETIIPIT